MEIKYYNRQTNKIEIEKVYGDGGVKWLYESGPGKFLSSALVKSPLSVLYGYMQDLGSSKNKIPSFVKNFDIQMDDYIPEDGRNEADPYSTFNKFFIRQFKEGKREFSKDPAVMPAFSEARYFGYDSIQDNDTVPVKGKFLNAKELLQKEEWIETFDNGPLLLARLCPVDYHRFHFPDNGKVIDNYKVGGLYHSVNPIALKAKEDIFSTNVREVTILETENFGKLAYVEVGAICVGKIIQSTDLTSFKRGDEKGYFLFGGSTVIVIGEKGKWKPSEDITKNTSKKLETYLHLGVEAATKL